METLTRNKKSMMSKSILIKEYKKLFDGLFKKLIWIILIVIIILVQI